MKTSHALSALFLVTALLLLTPPVAAAPPGPGPAIGTNLGTLTPNSGEWPFVDAFKTSLPWVPAQWWGCFGCPEAGTLDLDENGWVRSLDTSVPNGGQVAHTFLFLQAQGMYPAGTYTVLYDGTGFLDYDGSVTGVVRSPGRDLITVDPTIPEAISIVLASTDPADYLRNIRVIMPGGVCSDDPFAACGGNGDCAAGTCELFTDHYDTQVFHPTFLDNARPFAVLRLMDWMGITTTTFTEFSEYPTLASARWNYAPVEIMAELGNRLGADLWINVPHTASNDFVEELATRLHTHLDAAREVYVEYSNEVWNLDFPQFAYATAAGCAAWPELTAACDQDLAPGNGVACEGHPWPQWNESCEIARTRFTSRRSVEIWGIFDTAFGGTSRLVRVLAGQSGNTAMHQALLSFEDAHLATDAYATGAYFGWELGGDPQVAGWNLDQLFQALATQEVPLAIASMRDDAQFVAGSYPTVGMVTYEGGQGLVAWGVHDGDPNVIELFDDANRDPRMAQLYEQLLDGWLADGGGILFNHYVNVRIYRPWGRYGALEHQDQPHAQSVKYQALLDYIAGLASP